MGIDLGTLGARAIVVNGDGVAVGEGSHPLTSHREGGRHEQDPEDWWRAVAAACRQAVAEVHANALRAVAVCSTSGTMCLIDDGGLPVTPGIMYDDNRAADHARWVEDTGIIRKAFGYRVQPGWALAKLLWLLDKGIPAHARLAHQADFVVRRLVGHDVPADSSHALKTGYDAGAARWPPALSSVLGVPADVLPPVVRPGSRLGDVSTAAHHATGIRAGTTVVAGMTDGCAGQIASGAVDQGSVNSVLGTTLVLKAVTTEPFCDPSGVVYSHRSPDGHWLPGGASNVGAGVLPATFPNRDLDELINGAAAHEPSSTVAYPLIHRGERFPFLVPEAEGFLIGKPADDFDHCAALIQGVAFVERLALDHLAHHGAVLDGAYSSTGGGTRSRYWCQLRADVLGRGVRLPRRSESAFGMAILAAAAVREVPLREAAATMVAIVAELEPASHAGSIYRDQYLRLVDALAERGWITSELKTHAHSRGWAA